MLTPGDTHEVASTKRTTDLSRSKDDPLLAVRIPQPVLDELDAWIEKLNAQGKGRWSRTAVVHRLLVNSLADKGKRGVEP